MIPTVKLARELHAKRHKSNFATKYGAVKPVAMRVSILKNNTKCWYRGSAIYALFPPIEASEGGVLVDWYFVRVALSPEACDTGKPEATAFFSDTTGGVANLDNDEITKCRTILDTFPETFDDCVAVHLEVLGKMIPGISVDAPQ